MELKMNVHTSRILFQKDFSYKYQLSPKVRAPSRMLSQAQAKYEDDVLDVPASNQNTEPSYKNKLKFSTKDLRLKKDECT